MQIISYIVIILKHNLFRLGYNSNVIDAESPIIILGGCSTKHVENRGPSAEEVWRS